jgi:hypothetical protein
MKKKPSPMEGGFTVEGFAMGPAKGFHVQGCEFPSLLTGIHQ